MFDLVSAEVSSVCMNCRRGVACPPPAATEVPFPHVVDWFTSGGLSRLCPLYGWNTSSLSRPGEGSQSWLFCPLISLIGNQFGVLAFSTGPRAPVPDSQIQFWSHNAADIINAFAAHFDVLPRDDTVAAALSQSRSWGSSGDHLDAGLQEQATPAHILSTLEVSFSRRSDSSSRSAPSHPRWLACNRPWCCSSSSSSTSCATCSLRRSGRPLINSSPAHSPALRTPTHLRSASITICIGWSVDC